MTDAYIAPHKQATYYIKIILPKEQRGYNLLKIEVRGLALNLDNFISPCLQGLYPRRSFTYLCLLSNSITTLTILSLCAAFMFVLFAFSCVLIAPVPTVVCKSKIQWLLFPRSILVLILFVLVSVCVVWLCPSFESALLYCLQLCYFWPAVTDSVFTCPLLCCCSLFSLFVVWLSVSSATFSPRTPLVSQHEMVADLCRLEPTCVWLMHNDSWTQISTFACKPWALRLLPAESVTFPISDVHHHQLMNERSVKVNSCRVNLFQSWGLSQWHGLQMGRSW